MTRVNSIKDIGAVYISMKQAASEKAKVAEVAAKKPADVLKKRLLLSYPHFLRQKIKKLM